MPIESNDFARFRDTEAADRAALEAMGAACMQVTLPNCPVGQYPGTGKVGGNLKSTQRYVVSGDHVDIGVSAHYGGYVHNGTSRQKAQPWLKANAEANRESITAFGVREWKRVMGE